MVGLVVVFGEKKERFTAFTVKLYADLTKYVHRENRVVLLIILLIEMFDG